MRLPHAFMCVGEHENYANDFVEGRAEDGGAGLALGHATPHRGGDYRFRAALSSLSAHIVSSSASAGMGGSA